MNVRFLMLSIFQMGMIFNAQGGLTSSRSTISPNDVMAPPVRTVPAPVPQKESRKTDMLLGALSFGSAILPYLGQVTSMLSNDQVEAATQVHSDLVVQTDQVSRIRRGVEQDSHQNADSFFGVILAPFNVIWETATIIYDVLCVTKKQGLTDFQYPSETVRNKRDTFFVNPFKTLNNGPDLTNTYSMTLPNHVSTRKSIPQITISP